MTSGNRRRAWAGAFAVLGLGASLAFAACGDSSPQGGAPSGGHHGGQGGAGGGAPTFASSACGTCVLEACSDAVTECQATPECTSYLDCLLQCSLDELGNVDGACESACVPASESSAALDGRVALTSCRQEGAASSCDACTSSGPMGQDCQKTAQRTPCLQCYADKCCETRNACFGGDNPDCEALFDCVAPCGKVTYSEPCIADCFAQYPDVAQTLVEDRQCAFIECDNEIATCDGSLRDDCDACKYDTCGESLNNLIGSEDGYLTFICALDCAYLEAGPECYVACTDSYPDQKEAFLLWGECLAYWCEPICGQ